MAAAIPRATPRPCPISSSWPTPSAGSAGASSGPDEVDDAIREMIETPCAFVLDVVVDQAENCFPMIPSGAAHNEMLLGPADKAEQPVSEEGMVLV